MLERPHPDAVPFVAIEIIKYGLQARGIDYLAVPKEVPEDQPGAFIEYSDDDLSYDLFPVRNLDESLEAPETLYIFIEAGAQLIDTGLASNEDELPVTPGPNGLVYNPNSVVPVSVLLLTIDSVCEKLADLSKQHEFYDSSAVSTAWLSRARRLISGIQPTISQTISML